MNSGVGLLLRYIVVDIIMDKAKEIIAAGLPTQGQNIPIVKSPRTGPATMPFTLIAACRTVEVKLLAPNAHATAPRPEMKTMRRLAIYE